MLNLKFLPPLEFLSVKEAITTCEGGNNYLKEAITISLSEGGNNYL